MENEISLVDIFAGTLIEAATVKNLLENEEIEAFLKDEFVGTMFPWYTASGGAGSVKVAVSTADYDKAIQIVDTYLH